MHAILGRTVAQGTETQWEGVSGRADQGRRGEKHLAWSGRAPAGVKASVSLEATTQHHSEETLCLEKPKMLQASMSRGRPGKGWMSGPGTGGEEAAALGTASRQHTRRRGCAGAWADESHRGKADGLPPCGLTGGPGTVGGRSSGLCPMDLRALRPVTSVSPSLLWHEF